MTFLSPTFSFASKSIHYTLVQYSFTLIKQRGKFMFQTPKIIKSNHIYGHLKSRNNIRNGIFKTTLSVVISLEVLISSINLQVKHEKMFLGREREIDRQIEREREREREKRQIFDYYQNVMATCIIPFISTRNMVSYIKRGIQAKGILKQGPEANVWAQEG